MSRQPEKNPANDGTSKGGPGAALVVGLGASAGGLEPLQEFLEHVPAASGLVFVVIQHLEPNHPSMLAELLARHTAMPVLQASDGLPLESDHVYVIAPGTLLTIDKGVLHVVAYEGPSSSLIDAFLRSLADDQGEQAVAALFSGAGHDGTVGLRAIKEHGGLTLAQPPETATHDCMLQSAIGAGLVDHVVPVAQMPAIITEHAEHLSKFVAADAAENLDEQLAAHLGKICARIHQRTGHDFSRYKEGTLLRRIRRRLQVHHLQSVGDYLELLEKDPAEAEGLLKDLLIGVTQFFRDPEMFQTLAQQIIPRIVQGKSADAPIRVWVPGCASGEEAYSIAILLREHFDRLETRRFAQIFATDLDAAMLAEARHGRYPADIADQVSPERLARFFMRDPSNGSGRAADFQAGKELREMCIFSEHSLIRDPPFSQLDLISCRNVLIYLSAELQKKLVPLFHYALRPGGFLFLGPSEGISGSPELFEATDKRNRIFRRKETVTRPVVEFPLSSRSGARASGASPTPQIERRAQTPHEKIGAAFERTVLEEYAAPSAVINERGDVLFVAGPLSRHLQLPAGALTTTNLLEAFRGNLRQELRMALRAASAKRRKIVRRNISVESGDLTCRVHLTVRPMPAVEPEAGLFLVALQETEPPEESGAEDSGASEAAEPAVEQLEDELRTTRAELKTTVEELESANEELKSSNEELISTNEELQSANEEMQTSKEELQSLNEELETVNTELRQKVDELGSANSDLQNLFVATEIATIFLDRSLRVAKFTPAATALFHLIEADVGRPLADFAQRFAGQDLATDAQEVLRALTPIERQVRSADGAWFVLRVVPYRTVENLIAGVVVTFVDVTELKRAEEALRQTTEREHFLAEVVENASTPFGVGAPDGSLLLFNRAFAELTGYSREELEQRRLTWATDLTPPEWREREAEILSKASRTGEPVRYEKEYIRKDGSRVPIELFAQPVLDSQGHVVHYRSFLNDVSERKRAEAALRESEALLSFSLSTARTGAWDLDLVDHTAHRSLQHDQIFGYQELLPQWTYEMFIEHVLPEDREAVDRNFRQALATRGDWSFECRILRQDGTIRWIWAAGRHRADETGQPRRMAGIVQDITERKQAEAALRESHDRTTAILESIADAFYSLDDQWRFVVVNPAAERAPFGRPASELLGKVIWDVFPAIPGTRIHQHYLDAVQKRSHEHYEAQSPLNRRWYEVFMFPRTGGLDVYMRDITERKGAEEALRLSEEKFAKAFHGNTAAMAITRLHDGLFIDVNQRYLDITGWARGEVVGDKSPRLNIWRDPKDRDRFVRELQQHGMIRNAEFTFFRKGGGEWIGLVSSEVSTLGGEQVIINSITDITERKKAEEALRESNVENQRLLAAVRAEKERLSRAEEALRVANAQLTEADQRKNEFLAVLSHELRNPLTPIRNSLFVLERVAPGGDQARRAQEVIGRQSGQLARLVDDLLDVTRISRNKIQLQRSPLDLNELVRRTVEDHHSLFEAKGISIETALTAQRLPMSGDAARLAQMVGNLLHNAAKFTPAGGRVAVSTAAAPSRGRATLRVSDNGVGIEPAMLSRLFQPFMQAEATLDRSKGGLGLGLALVKGLVEMHGGDVCAHSDGPGKGAEFVVELPLEATAADQAVPTVVGAKQSRRRVLIIEDNIDAADSLREVLAFGGHVVEVAYNGPEGLARAREFKPEVVLCDIGLPGMDGFEVARAFRADAALKAVFLVALSGYALPEDLQRAQEAGFDRHLAKPPSFEKIEEALASGRRAIS
jgi:two-component system CheB/CheR fusion protein